MGFVPGATAQPTTAVKPAISTLNIKPSDAALSAAATEKAIAEAMVAAKRSSDQSSGPSSDQSSGDLTSELGTAGKAAVTSMLDPVIPLFHLL